MTDREINEAVALAIGFTHENGAWLNPNGRTFCGCPPKFATSLDACAMFEQKLNDADRKGWAFNVSQSFTESQSKSSGWTQTYYLITATPRQRCEAFLRMKGLWK